VSLSKQTNEFEINLLEIDEIVEGVGTQPKDALNILLRIQSTYRYLPEEALRRVCEITKITPAQITGVSTFYSQFRHKPVGKHIIKVCHGTACYVLGAERITEAVRKHLDIPEDADTDAGRLFTVENVACLGCCSLAPCLMIGEITYGHLTPQNTYKSVENFLKDYGE
jgi:NADH:ubiquinone oxidoreductase subunit E